VRESSLTTQPLGKGQPPLSSPASRLHWVWLLSRDSGAVAGSSILLIVLLMSTFGPVQVTADPLKADMLNAFQPPSRGHLLGTDILGRDVLARLLYGGRVSLTVGMGTTLATLPLGGILGLIAGYFDRVDGIIMRAMDGLMAFPNMMLAIAIMAVRGPGVENVIVAMTVSSAPRLARLMRGQVLAIRSSMYVESAICVGASRWRILFRHILPNSVSPLIVQSSFTFAVAVVVEAGMSFLGAGVPPQVPAWGNMLQEGVQAMTRAPWMSVFPGLALVFIVLGLNLLGDGLRDSLDPRLHGR